MFVAKQKRQENIAEYLLYMWQVEDILRALRLDPDQIHRYVERGYRCTDEERAEVEQWYLTLAEEMRREGVVERGHLRRLTDLMDQLEELSSQLLRQKEETLFATLYYAALPAIVQLRDKAGDSATGEVETAFVGLYGYIQLRERGSEVSEETLQGMKQLSTFLAMLADRFRRIEEGEMTLEEE